MRPNSQTVAIVRAIATLSSFSARGAPETSARGGATEMPPFAVGGRNVRETAIREGHEIFTNELTRFAQRVGDARVAALSAELGGPLRVAVLGRDGVGRATVAAALADAGLIVFDDNADVSVVVVAEALKPEDRAMLAAPASLLVLNKADLAGFGAGGPIAVADRRAAELQAMAGVPTVPMVGLLAAATVDDELVAALRVLTAEPVDLASTDG